MVSDCCPGETETSSSNEKAVSTSDWGKVIWPSPFLFVDDRATSRRSIPRRVQLLPNTFYLPVGVWSYQLFTKWICKQLLGVVFDILHIFLHITDVLSRLHYVKGFHIRFCFARIRFELSRGLLKCGCAGGCRLVRTRRRRRWWR